MVVDIAYLNMAPEAGSVETASTDSHEVVAAVDEAEGQPRLIIADIARDDAWLSVPETGGVSLDDWR